MAALRSRFAEAVNAPVFSIPGEHDLFEGLENYERFFGPAYYRIAIGAELFLFLDSGGNQATEASAEQLDFLSQSLELAARDDRVRNVIVLMHKVVFAALPRYERLRDRINNVREGGFWGDVYPELRKLAESKRVLVGAGDIGHKSYSFFYDENPDDGIGYFCTGLADLASDSVVLLTADGEGGLELEPISLTAAKIDAAATTLEGFTAWIP